MLYFCTLVLWLPMFTEAKRFKLARDVSGLRVPRQHSWPHRRKTPFRIRFISASSKCRLFRVQQRGVHEAVPKQVQSPSSSLQAEPQLHPETLRTACLC